MSIYCPHCNAVAGRGFELSHASWCPKLKEQEKRYTQWHEANLSETRKRLKLLLDEWTLYQDPKSVLEDILKSWPQ